MPHGSVLGPMLFSIYTRDVPSESSPASSLQFADDIALACARRTAQEVSDALSLAVTSLSSWLDARGLVLNAKKSNVLVFTSSSGQQPDVVVRCRNDVLPHTNCRSTRQFQKSVPLALALPLNLKSRALFFPGDWCWILNGRSYRRDVG